MTKAAMCLHCGQIIGPRPRWREDAAWTWCADPCAHTAVRWRDGQQGLLEVTSCHGEDSVAVLGLNNRFIAGLAETRFNDEGWRHLHEFSTDAPDHLFDKSRRACWAVLVRPGESGDVFFMPYGAAWLERPATGGSLPETINSPADSDPSCPCGEPGVAVRGGKDWLCRRHADQYDAWGPAWMPPGFVGNDQEVRP